MSASGVNAAIMRAMWKLEQKKRAIGNARIWVARISGFYCMIKKIPSLIPTFEFTYTRKKIEIL